MSWEGGGVVVGLRAHSRREQQLALLLLDVEGPRHVLARDLVVAAAEH